MSSIVELSKKYEQAKGNALYGNTYTGADAEILNEVGIREGSTDLSALQVNDNGTLACINRRYHTMTESVLYANKFKMNGEKSLLLACGSSAYLAVKAKNNGQPCPYISVPVYEITRVNKSLKVVSLSSVSKEEFDKDFNNTLDNKAMKEILPLVNNMSVKNSSESLPF